MFHRKCLARFRKPSPEKEKEEAKENEEEAKEEEKDAAVVEIKLRDYGRVPIGGWGRVPPRPGLTDCPGNGGPFLRPGQRFRVYKYREEEAKEEDDATTTEEEDDATTTEEEDDATTTEEEEDWVPPPRRCVRRWTGSSPGNRRPFWSPAQRIRFWKPIN